MRKIDADELVARYPNCRDLKQKADGMPTALLTAEELVIAAKVTEAITDELESLCKEREFCDGCEYLLPNNRCVVSTVDFAETMESFKMVHGCNWESALRGLIERCSQAQ